jgi:hypothetical protein
MANGVKKKAAYQPEKISKWRLLNQYQQPIWLQESGKSCLEEASSIESAAYAMGVAALLKEIMKAARPKCPSVLL